ncbi:MAG: hypothetical protein IPP29_14365 [Bacteroidetes bacterium]|nr:hypothetical protein [Bacteroidota bacterium]
MIVTLLPDTIQLMQSANFPVNGQEGGTACFSPDGSKYVWNNCYGVAFLILIDAVVINFDR